MKPNNSAEVRQAFLDYFQEMGHEVVNSSPLPIYDNPTLLFTNAGMNQFVDTFLGKEPRAYLRATSSQKCMRVQGKHNDLENVGPSPRHHTFFEMLGNFSFGDYFKEGAIQFAFTFMTKVCEIPEEKLWYTVHDEDDNAYDIWVNKVGVSPERVLRMGDKTNFWMMGDVGPCGPTSEIHYDWGPGSCTCDEPDCSVFLDNDCGRWLEIWNLVFMQFDQAEDGSRTPLPSPGVDTGMGLERITAVVQQKPVNYETDLFEPVMNRIQELIGDSDDERSEHFVNYRVIADHGRAATFLIADGVLPGNVGRGYVLRMIIRRAARFGREIGLTEPFLSEIAKVYIDQMADVYPEVKINQDHIEHTITLEERRFARTLDGALNQLETILADMVHNHQQVLPGEMAFDLYATHGLPLEITKDVVNERGFDVDEAGFKLARNAHAEASGAGAFGQYDTKDSFYADVMANLQKKGHIARQGVDYDPYASSRIESELLAILRDEKLVDEAKAGESIGLVCAATPFYVEAGGEVSDTGTIVTDDPAAVVQVEDVKQPVPGLIVHVGRLISGELLVGQRVTLQVDEDRRWDIRRNHTATHVLHRELRRHLGTHVAQQGSLVAPNRLRFDFSHDRAVESETLSLIEEAINLEILKNQPVHAGFMSQKEAVSAGAMALFGEKYGEIVRTIKIGDVDEPYSFELCGGLHVGATGDIGLFKFTSEEAVGAGLRRVEAITGREAQRIIQQRLATLENLSEKLNTPISDIEQRLDAIIDDNRAMNKELVRLRRKQAKTEFEDQLEQIQSVDGIPLMVSQVHVADMDSLREIADWFRDRVNSGVGVFAAVVDDRVLLIVAVTDDLISKGVRAGDLVGDIAKLVDGGGGGRPSLAQAGGKSVAKLPTALDSVPDILSRHLNR